MQGPTQRAGVEIGRGFNTDRLEDEHPWIFRNAGAGHTTEQAAVHAAQGKLAGLRPVCNDVSRLIDDVNTLRRAVASECRNLRNIVIAVSRAAQTAAQLTVHLRRLASEAFVSSAPKARLSAANVHRQQELIARGSSNPDPELKAHARELQRLVEAQQMALLSEAAYQPGSSPFGWVNISDDDDALAQLGLTREDLSGGGFRCQAYRPDLAVFPQGSQKISIAFRGSSNWDDWRNNVLQGVGVRSSHYERAVAMGNKVAASGRASDVRFTGHSLGGGLAAVAAKTCGCTDAVTFNAAGEHGRTLSIHGGTDHPETLIRAYRVEGEILTLLQQGGWGPVGDMIAQMMPNPRADELVVLPPYSNPIARHFLGDVHTRMHERVSGQQSLIENNLSTSEDADRALPSAA